MMSNFYRTRLRFLKSYNSKCIAASGKTFNHNLGFTVNAKIGQVWILSLKIGKKKLRTSCIICMSIIYYEPEHPASLSKYFKFEGSKRSSRSRMTMMLLEKSSQAINSSESKVFGRCSQAVFVKIFIIESAKSDGDHNIFISPGFYASFSSINLRSLCRKMKQLLPLKVQVCD